MTLTDLAALDTEMLRGFVSGLEDLADPGDDAERIEAIRLLEELKSAAAAAQARLTTRFVASQTAAQVDAGVRPEKAGAGVAAQVGLAKRESPARARRYVGFASLLVRELPRTFAALQRGVISEWRAQIVTRETAWLDLPGRTMVDAELGPRLEDLGDRQVEAEAKRLAYRHDPRGYLARIAQAESNRRVSLRPAPEAMTYLTGLLPMAQGVAVHVALTRHADSLRAHRDERSRGQIMADTLVERLTGQSAADKVRVEVNLVMTDHTLFNTDSGGDAVHSAGEPAHVDGYGPIPADLARRLALAAAEAGPDGSSRLWLRRLYTDPDTGQLAGMDARSRCFPANLAKLLVLRDQVCRIPWCDAPIRHSDHVIPAAHDGPTDVANGQGLCEACNHSKQAPGWNATPSPGGAGSQVVITTPTGHTYRSRPPDPPRTGSFRRTRSPGERHLAALLRTAA